MFETRFGITHDFSKLRLRELIPYSNFFYGNKAITRRDPVGYYKPTDTGDKAFDLAWLHHQKVNDHHWQWWVLPEDNGGIKVLPMSHDARAEMVCDWIGAGRAQGTPDTVGWYKKHKDKMMLHPETREWVESTLGIDDEK